MRRDANKDLSGEGNIIRKSIFSRKHRTYSENIDGKYNRNVREKILETGFEQRVPLAEVFNSPITRFQKKWSRSCKHVGKREIVKPTF